MNKNLFLSIKNLFWISLFCFLSVSAYDKDREDTRPNLILITPNRLGLDQLKQYGGLNHNTPNIDYLANKGITFYYFYGRTNMSSSWRALVTGAPDSEKGDASRIYKISNVQYSLARKLREVDYQTCFAGKWRWGGWSDYDSTKLVQNAKLASPITLGFEHYRAVHSKLGHKEDPLWAYIEAPNDPYWGTRGIFESSTIKYKNETYQPHSTYNYIEGFIDHALQKTKRRPFYLWWSMIYLYNHSSNWYPKTPDYKKKRSKNEMYYANIRYMDKMIGRLIQKLKKEKILENTLILFVGISGTPQGVEGIYRGEKSLGTNIFHSRADWEVTYPEERLEKNYRLPFIVHWPKYIKEKKVNGDFHSIEDIMVTLAKAGHAKKINNYITQKETFKSYNLLPIFKGHKNKGERRPLIYMFVQPRLMAQPYIKASFIFAQTREYKLYIDGKFYRLWDDPNEEHPLSTLSPLERAIKAKLKYYINLNPTERVIAN